MRIDSRREYNRHQLLEGDLPDDPIAAFQNWFEEAMQEKIPDYNAFHLATSDAQGYVSGRIVLLKSIENNQFLFYTNYDSKKGQQIEDNNRVAATFFWSALERQVRIEGTISRVESSKSDAYFKTRPIDSQAAAAASRQSEKIENREALENRFEAFRSQDTIERPEHWGGYAINPVAIEFWQGRPSRLNDRIAYDKTENGWEKNRLSP